ncbi:nucleoside deaminase [Microbulbifer sp. OS29]|uniref:Nucleoside deaminase n=1 Tax=Microbulbifer okhotskensis TaxID=2926617 RepID=A0A9X2J455_9GAMM|nr:nucleoside deaminase [Microbulbifer okhotskensis]MCO1333748.1 nucleoside deaminase [Microbulbifer okhotskensis]
MYRLLIIAVFLIITPCAYSDLSASEEREQDEILMLLAYSLVMKNWVVPGEKKKRGYNIGAVLFDEKSDKIIGVQLNSIGMCRDKTQHAELRLMQQCLFAKCRGEETNSLTGTTIYTTLEPCMMCAGMMVFLGVNRVVYGQSDPDFGKTIERLKQEYRSGCSYKVADKNRLESICRIEVPPNFRARNIVSRPSGLLEREQLDNSFSLYRLQFGNVITNFLMSGVAEEVYRQARKKLNDYKVINNVNQSIYRQAISTLRDIKLDNMALDQCALWQGHKH